MSGNDKPGKITVAHVVQNLDVGGLERVVLSLINRADRSRFDPYLCCLGDGGTLASQAKCPVETINKQQGFSFRLPLHMARLLKRHHTDIVHSHNFSPLVYGAIGGKLAGVAGVVYTMHGATTSSNRKQVWLERLNLVDKVVAVSEDARGVAVRKAGFASDKVVSIANGVDLDSYSHGANRAATRRELDLTDDMLVFAIVARLTPAKDHVILFDAFEHLRKNHDNAVLLVVGDGELEDELVRYVSDRGIDGIRFLGRRSDIADILGAVDVFVLSSRTEGLSITLLEAAAAGLPIVATRVGGNGEVVVHEETGLLVPPRDAEAIAGAMGWMASHRERARDMGKRGSVRVKETFDSDVMVRRYEALYHELVGR